MVFRDLEYYVATQKKVNKSKHRDEIIAGTSYVFGNEEGQGERNQRRKRSGRRKNKKR